MHDLFGSDRTYALIPVYVRLTSLCGNQKYEYSGLATKFQNVWS